MNVSPEHSVIFAMPGEDPFRPQWQVIMREDGSLSIMTVNRRPGNVLVMPSAHNAVVVTNEKIVRGNQ